MRKREKDVLAGWALIAVVIAYPFVWLYQTFGWGGYAVLAIAVGIGLLLWAWPKKKTIDQPVEKTRIGRRASNSNGRARHDLRSIQIFQESAQIVAQTKNKATARSRYELMLRLWQEGTVDVDGVSILLQQARTKTEALEAGNKIAPTQIAVTSEVVDSEFMHQLRNAEAAITAGEWEQARWAIRSLGYQTTTASPSLQNKIQLLGKRIVLEDPRYQVILAPLLTMISASPGQKQTACYAHFPESPPEELREILYWAAQSNILRRVKKGNTYLLYLPEN